MHLSENEGIQGNVFAVTGGLGYVGAALCKELVRRGAREVRSFDRRPHSSWSLELRDLGVNCIQGDISCRGDVERALRGADCVFHLASYGMSGKEILHFGRVDEVNINGTCHVLEACAEMGVSRLVYVSTYNVVFGGKEIVNGDENLPYFPIDGHVDSYGRCKSIAEQLVLKSNGRPLKKKKGKHLYTCAVRPAAIYGPGEERHLPRIVSLAKLGLLPLKIGQPSVKSDWIYIDNFVLALVLASMGLLDDIPGSEGPPVAAGQPYFVSDGSPVNSFEFLLPLLKSLDYDVPEATISVPHAIFIGKVGVTHYFSFLKARQELGYVPMVTPREGMVATIAYWQDRKRKSLDGPTIYTWLLVVIGMISMIAAAYFPEIGPVRPLKALSVFLFRSIWMIRLVCILAVAAHVGEAVYAYHLAKRVDPANSRGWFWQTFVLGIFSLRFLLKRAQR